MRGKETELIERYQIISSISQDALGKVYLAEDTLLSRNIALRHIKAELHNEEGFKEYAGSLVGLNHPGVLATYDLAIAKGKVYFVSQFLDGESLAEVVKQGPMKAAEVYAMAEQLVDAMQAILGAGLSHGTFNLGSVKRSESVAGRHRYLICDLGFSELACLLGMEDVNLGDFLMKAPEMVDEKAVPDEKSMMFSIGQLCYTVLAGGHPFAGKSADETRDSYLKGEFPPIQSYVSDLQEDFANWIMQMVAVEPGARFETFAQAAKSLGGIEVVEPLDAETAAIAVAAMARTGPQPAISQEATEATEAVQTTTGPQVNLTNPATHVVSAEKTNELSSKFGMEKKQLVIISSLCVLVLVVVLFLTLGGGSGDKNDNDSVDAGKTNDAKPDNENKEKETAKVRLGAYWLIDFQGDSSHGGFGTQTGPRDADEPARVFSIQPLNSIKQTAYQKGGKLNNVLDNYGENPITLAFSDNDKLVGWAGYAEKDSLYGDGLLMLAIYGMAGLPVELEISGLVPGANYSLSYFPRLTPLDEGLRIAVGDVEVTTQDGQPAAVAQVRADKDGRIVQVIAIKDGFKAGTLSALNIRRLKD